MIALLLVTLLLTYALPVYTAEGSESQDSIIFGEDYISYANSVMSDTQGLYIPAPWMNSLLMLKRNPSFC